MKNLCLKTNENKLKENLDIGDRKNHKFFEEKYITEKNKKIILKNLKFFTNLWMYRNIQI